MYTNLATKSRVSWFSSESYPTTSNSVRPGCCVSTTYGVLWWTVVTSGVPYKTPLSACTVTKYSPSESRSANRATAELVQEEVERKAEWGSVSGSMSQVPMDEPMHQA